MHSIALFGGTFDPVHNGHIQTSRTIQASFNFDSYYFLPCNIPVIKPPTVANRQQRIDMLELVLKHYPEFKIDLREINRDSPSYMVDTLNSFRSEYPDASITLIVGYDTFLSLPKWYQWEKITKLANLLVINRNQFANTPIPIELKKLTEVAQQCTSKELLVTHHAGMVCFFNAGSFQISSTDIRKKLKNNQEIEDTVPKEIQEYINQWTLYR